MSFAAHFSKLIDALRMSKRPSPTLPQNRRPDLKSLVGHVSIIVAGTSETAHKKDEVGRLVILDRWADSYNKSETRLAINSLGIRRYQMKSRAFPIKNNQYRFIMKFPED